MPIQGIDEVEHQIRLKLYSDTQSTKFSSKHGMGNALYTTFYCDKKK